MPTAEYSRTEAIDRGTEQAVLLFPNPAKGWKKVNDKGGMRLMALIAIKQSRENSHLCYLSYVVFGIMRRLIWVRSALSTSCLR